MTEQEMKDHALRMWDCLGHTEAKCGPKEKWIAGSVVAQKIEWERIRSYTRT